MKFGLMFHLKKNDIWYIRRLLALESENPDNIIKIVDKCGDKILEDKGIFFSIENIVPDWNSNSSFCSNYKFMKMAVKYSGENLDYAKCEIDEELVKLALTNGYEMNEKTPKIISDNRNYVEFLIKKCGGNQIDYATCEIDEELIDLALENDYFLYKHSSKVISGNIEFVKKIMDKTTSGVSQINNSTCEIDEELFNKILEMGYYMNDNSPLSICGKKEFVKALIKKWKKGRGDQLDYAKCEIDEELISLAIDNGYYLTSKSPIEISGDKKYVKMLIEKQGGNQLDYAKCEIDEELISLAINKGYYLTPNSSIEISGNKECVKVFIQKYAGNQLDYATCEIDEELIDLAIDNGYCLGGGSSPKEISGSKKYVKMLIEKQGGRQLDDAICEIDEDLINLAIDNGYYLTYYSPIKISGNKEYVKMFIEKYDGNQLHYATCALDDELICLAINNGYRFYFQLPSQKEISGNKKYVKMIIEKQGGNQLYYAKCVLDDELISLAINKGYCLDDFSPIEISGNKKYVKMLIEKQGGNQLVYAKCVFDDELISLAINNGYCLDGFSPIAISGNKKYVKMLIEKQGGNQLDYATCEIDEELFGFAINHGLICSVSNANRYDNVNLDKYFNSILEGKTKSYKDKLKKIKEKTNSFVVCCLSNNLILNEKIIDGFGIDLVVRCIKYLYLLGNYIDLELFLIEENMNCFKFIFTDILKVSFEDIPINEFHEIINNYSLYSNLIINIMQSGVQITDEDKNKLVHLFKNRDNRIKVKELTDLDNISNMVIEANEHAIESNDILKIKKAIYLTSFNIGYNEIIKLRKNFKLNINKITELLKSIENEETKSILENYQVLFEIIDFIEKCQDIEVLKAFLSQVNINLSKDNNYFKESHNLFYNIIDKMKYFYGVEIFEKMSVENINQEEKTLKATNGKKVQCFSISSNQYYFQHTLNAYGSGGKLSDFKNPRVVGKTYICLSLIDNNHTGVKRDTKDIDHVTLLFNKLSPSSLCAFSEKDMYSRAGTNSRDIQYNYANFDTVKNTLENTKRYNEYVYYREDNMGEFIYPTGVLVTGDEPSQVEIDAAEYLGVTLIKLNPIKEKVREESTDKDKRDKKQNLIKELESMKEYILGLNIVNEDLNNDTTRKMR